MRIGLMTALNKTLKSKNLRTSVNFWTAIFHIRLNQYINIGFDKKNRLRRYDKTILFIRDREMLAFKDFSTL